VVLYASCTAWSQVFAVTILVKLKAIPSRRVLFLSAPAVGGSTNQQL